jgi:hypothetical protein
MIYNILDENLEPVGDIDEAISKIWDKHYRDKGYVEIYAAVTPRALSMLKEGYYITREDDPCVARIYSVATDTTEDDGEVIVAAAHFAQAVLGQRIIWNTTSTEGNAEAVGRSLIVDNCIAPTDRQGRPMPARVIHEIELAEPSGLSDKMEAGQVSYANLLEYILEICATFHYGLRAIMNTGNTKIAVGFYTGTDRSYRQSQNTFVVFSQENENLLGFSYKHDESPKVNAALIGGEGEGIDRTLAQIGTAAGLERCEVFVDAKDVTSTIEKSDGTKQTYTAEQYNKLLEERGRLNMKPADESFDASVDLTRSYQYRKDFDVGDIVTIYDQHTGVYVNVRLMSVLETEDASGYTLTPTFAIDF